MCLAKTILDTPLVSLLFIEEGPANLAKDFCSKQAYK